jgi:hypothetical protein
MTGQQIRLSVAVHNLLAGVPEADRLWVLDSLCDAYGDRDGDAVAISDAGTFGGAGETLTGPDGTELTNRAVVADIEERLRALAGGDVAAHVAYRPHLGVTTARKVGDGEAGYQEPGQPPVPPLIYLRGAGVKDTAWNRLRRGCWTHGWSTVDDRTTAWHAARGGRTVVLADFSVSELWDVPVHVALLRARWDESEEWCTVGELLSTSEYVRLAHGGVTWLNRGVSVPAHAMELQEVAVIDGARRTETVEGRRRLDMGAVVATIQRILAAGGGTL